MRARRRGLGQTTTEYLLVISVIVIGVTAAVYNPMRTAMQQGSQSITRDMKQNAKMGGVNVSEKR